MAGIHAAPRVQDRPRMQAKWRPGPRMPAARAGRRAPPPRRPPARQTTGSFASSDSPARGRPYALRGRP